MNTNEYLDAVKKKCCIESDYALSKRMGCSHQRISNYRVGKSVFDGDIVLKVGELLRINPAVVWANIEAERAKDDQARKMWKRVASQASRLAPSVGAVMLTATLLGGTPPSPAQAYQVVDFNGIYIMRIYIMRNLQ